MSQTLAALHSLAPAAHCVVSVCGLMWGALQGL
jgi:hypothetical protein